MNNDLKNYLTDLLSNEIDNEITNKINEIIKYFNFKDVDLIELKESILLSILKLK